MKGRPASAGWTAIHFHFDDREELAPRDIVARAIDFEMKRLGADCVFLDISHQPADLITRHFPQAYERCLALGIDITRDRIPVVPAAHYTCGGVVVDQYGAAMCRGFMSSGSQRVRDCTGEPHGQQLSARVLRLRTVRSTTHRRVESLENSRRRRPGTTVVSATPTRKW